MIPQINQIIISINQNYQLINQKMTISKLE